ncbi:MAG: hypothetical protein ACJ8AS_05665 [Hyphomicrobiales bacterium]|jgi:hypothetical protein
MNTTERTTVRLPAQLLREAKKKAAQEGTTLTALIETGLRHVLRRNPSAVSGKRPRVSLARGNVMIDVSSNVKLFDLADEDLPLEKLR